MAEVSKSDFELRMEAAIAYWDSKRSRLTQVREILCEIIFRTTKPFEPEWLHQEARKQDKLISIASVYRTLKNLREADLVEEFLSKTEKGYYQLSPISNSASSSIHCKNCGKVIPVSDPCLTLRESAQAQKHGFKATQVRLQTEATCEEFEETGECKRDLS